MTLLVIISVKFTEIEPVKFNEILNPIVLAIHLFGAPLACIIYLLPNSLKAFVTYPISTLNILIRRPEHKGLLTEMVFIGI